MPVMVRHAPIFVAAMIVMGCQQPLAWQESAAAQTETESATDVGWHRATGALDGNCGNSGKNPDGSYEFMVPCPASFPSPDGRWKIVMGVEAPEGGAPVTIQKGDGSHFAAIPDLSDGMPFTIFWSPRPNWFLVSHHVGSFMRKPEVYEITKLGVVRHDAITREGGRLAKQLSPCLPAPKWDWANGEAVGWSRDGKTIAWLFYARTDACMGSDETGPVPPDKQWKPFWMISDAKTGAIVPGSIRVDAANGPLKFPTDAMYTEFRRAGL